MFDGINPVAAFVCLGDVSLIFMHHLVLNLGKNSFTLHGKLSPSFGLMLCLLGLVVSLRILLLLTGYDLIYRTIDIGELPCRGS